MKTNLHEIWFQMSQELIGQYGTSIDRRRIYWTLVAIQPATVVAQHVTAF